MSRKITKVGLGFLGDEAVVVISRTEGATTIGRFASVETTTADVLEIDARSLPAARPESGSLAGPSIVEGSARAGGTWSDFVATASLGGAQPFVVQPGWPSDGASEWRNGASARETVPWDDEDDDDEDDSDDEDEDDSDDDDLRGAVTSRVQREVVAPPVEAAAGNGADGCSTGDLRLTSTDQLSEIRNEFARLREQVERIGGAVDRL